MILWIVSLGCLWRNKLLHAQERPATLILTVTSRLRITLARHVYNRDAKTGNWNFVLQLRTIRMRKMCQSQQFVTWLHGIQASVTPAQTFAGRKLKTQRSSKMFFFSRTWARNIYKFVFVWIVNWTIFQGYFFLQTHALQKSFQKPWLRSETAL